MSLHEGLSDVALRQPSMWQPQSKNAHAFVEIRHYSDIDCSSHYSVVLKLKLQGFYS